ncbi:MAG: hypothetical protein K9N23_11855 [Akkermansiaceae bacterium]|nr:hypothetical protein [Akkermansiaceae bacterium]
MSGNSARNFGKPPTTWFRSSEPALAGSINERQLTRFFHTPVGQQETRQLVAMIGKARPNPEQHIPNHVGEDR